MSGMDVLRLVVQANDALSPDAFRPHGQEVSIHLDDLRSAVALYDQTVMQLRRAHAQLDGEPNHEEETNEPR